jgi:cyclopropane fatty-acyl-phospholipid synthase-like methyltransferase
VPAEFFADAYESTPPWDIGRPQPAIVKLAMAGEISGPVLDVGCGTGENALFLASRGLQVVGVDMVPAAVEAARRKAAARGLEAAAEFLLHDALAVDRLGRQFATVLDSGLFHALDDAERLPFARALAASLAPGGHYFALSFSELEVRPGGPRRVTQADLRATFDRAPLRVVSIEPSRMATLLEGSDRHCWLTRVERLPEPGG